MGIPSINQLLEQEHSKKQTLLIADLIVSNKESLIDLVSIVENNEKPYSQRAAWVLSLLVTYPKNELNKHTEKLISCLTINYHEAVLRAIFKVMAKSEIKEKYEGILFEKGMQFLTNKSTPTGIKTWVIEVLMKIALKHPDLFPELKLVLESQQKNCPIGIKGKINKCIQKINLI